MATKGSLKILDKLSNEDLLLIKKDLSIYSSGQFMTIWPDISKKNYYKLLKYFEITPPKISSIWCTNGLEDCRIFIDETLPEGFHYGRIKYGSGTKDTKWVTNGENTKLIKKSDVMPSGYHYGSSNKTTQGYKTYNNGIEQICLKPGIEIPPDFTKGILDSTNYKLAAAQKKVTIYNNGATEIKLTSNDKIPDGFIPGKLYKTKEQKLKAQLLKQYEYSDNFLFYRLNKNNTIKLLSTFKSKPTYDELQQLFPEVGIQGIYNWIKNFELEEYIEINQPRHSSYEVEIRNLFPTIYFESNRTILNGLEIDLFAKDYNLGIEFNGTYWHSSIFKSKNYHLNKSLLAEQQGIHLIHIYEYEWTNPKIKSKIIKLLNILLNINITRIYARDCNIKQISNQEAKLFNEKTHLQGHRNAQVTYGLFYNNELVQLMSFSKTKYNKNLKNDNEWEIIRGCPGSNNIVVGGVSKLFKHFVNDYHPSKVFSYCDFNKFNGKSYEILGMKFLDYTGPDMHWWLKSGEVVNRNPNKHKEYKENSIAQIWGAGSKKYIIEFNS